MSGGSKGHRMWRVLRGGTVMTMNASGDIFDPGALLMEGSRIAYVGPQEGAPEIIDAEIRDVRDHVVMPGLVNVHTHACMNLFRGLADDAPRGTWLSDYIWPLDARVTPDDLKTAALAACYEMLRNGVTCVADRYAHMDAIVDAFVESGIRAVVTTSLLDVGRRPELDKAEALISRWGVTGENRISAGFGPHATDTCSTELLRTIRRLADDTGAKMFIHVAQSQEEVDAVRARGAMGAVSYLYDIGFLGPDVIAAHCLYVTTEEVSLLAGTGTHVAHCPVSNAKIEARIAPVDEMVRAGVSMALGTDCAPSNNGMDLFQEMRCAALLGKVQSADPMFLPAEEVVRLATSKAAQVLGLEQRIGSLEVGKRADVITIRTRSLHVQPWNNPYGNLVYCCTGQDVDDVFVDGEAIVSGGTVEGVRIDDLIARMRRITGERGLRDVTRRAMTGEGPQAR